MCGCGFKYVAGPPNQDGTYQTVLKELIPTYNGIAVSGSLLYGFSINLKLMDLSATQVGLMWFASPGGVGDQIGNVVSDPWTPPNDEWYSYTVQGFPPEDPSPGQFLIPYVRVVDTWADIPLYMAGAQVYAQSDTGVVTAFAPDRYITLGDVDELLGEDEGEGGGFLLGNPTE
jgi:hypothetical protein